MTKGGLMGHFPTKEALLLGIQQYLADRWEQAMVATAGKTAAQATPQERVAAYARVATTSATSAEMALILDFAQHLPDGTALGRGRPALDPQPSGGRHRRSGLRDVPGQVGRRWAVGL